MSLKSGKKWVTWYKFEQSDWFGINYHIGILVYSEIYTEDIVYLYCSTRQVYSYTESTLGNKQRILGKGITSGIFN